MEADPYSHGHTHPDPMAQGRIPGTRPPLSHRSWDATRWYLLPHPVEYGGAPVRARRYCVFDNTVSWWELTSLLGRRPQPSLWAVVSLPRTARVVRGTPTLKKRPCR